MPSIKITEVYSGNMLSKLPDTLNLSITPYNEALLIRLLLGTANIQLEHESIIVRQRANLSNALDTQNNRLHVNIVKNYLTPLKIEDLDLYLKKTANTNYTMFNDLIYEYSNYFICTQRGNHTSAFMYLYRILEYISYSFPLIHASSSHNYTGTFNNLQSYFTKEGSELIFLIKFITKLFDSDPIINTTTDIQVQAKNSQIQDIVYKSYKRIIPNFIDSYDDSDRKFSIPYSKLVETIISIRNRYFHFAIGGQKNIRTAEIEYPEVFFAQINHVAINWISIIYFEVLKIMIERWR